MFLLYQDKKDGLIRKWLVVLLFLAPFCFPWLSFSLSLKGSTKAKPGASRKGPGDVIPRRLADLPSRLHALESVSTGALSSYSYDYCRLYVEPCNKKMRYVVLFFEFWLRTGCYGSESGTPEGVVRAYSGIIFGGLLEYDSMAR